MRPQSYKADKAYVDLRQREGYCLWFCFCVGAWGGCEREGKGSKGIFGNIKKGGGAENATFC